MVLSLVSAFAAASFQPLPYSDPFAPGATAGVLSYSQPANTVVFNENLSSFTLPITRPGTALTNGLSGITIEWWMKQKPNANTPITDNPNGTILHGPGFAVNADWQWGGGAGSLIVNLSQNKAGQYSGRRGAVIPLKISDEQWHYYAVTYDLRTVRSFVDGELLEQRWLDNNTDQIGPFEDDSFAIRTSVIEAGGGVTTSGSRFQNGFLEGARVSTTPLSPGQVRRNFENARTYTKTLYVSPNGTGNGTLASPTSLASALSQITGSTRIILLGGTYNGDDFQVTRSGTAPREHCVIVGADGSTPAVISGGTPALNGAGYISLRNLTFSSDNGAALQVNNSVKPISIDACRFSGAQRGLSISASPSTIIENCVVNAGVGIYLAGSMNTILRNNTIVNGSTGVQFDTGCSRATFLNNLMSGQSYTCLLINSDSQREYRGNANLYNPSGVTAAIVNGQSFTPAQVRNKQLANAWYTFDVQDVADSRQRRVGYAAEANSMAFAPTFVDAANGDFRLAAVQGNAIDAGADRTFLQWNPSRESDRRGALASIADATGAARAQGNAVDVGAFETVPLNYAVFNLDSNYTCSAGVYKQDGTLIRTLFSGQKRAAGTNVIFWNGLDDNKDIAAAGTYTIKMIAHNVQYVWEGVVGNTSSPLANSSAHGGFEPIAGLATFGNTAFYTAGYNESKYELYRFATTNINRVTKSFGPIHDITSDAAWDLATDGTKLYTLNMAQVAVYNVSDCSATTFGNGSSKINSGNGRGFIEVQRNGNLLFVSRGTSGASANSILIFDKYSGNQTGSISVNDPRDMAMTASGDLWVLSGNDAVRFAVTSTGGTPVQTITGFTKPISIACSPVDGMVIVADASTHQVKAFSSAGAALWTLGQANGYANSPRVTADKFYFVYINEGQTYYMAPLAFQDDGSFWVCDTFLSRALHFNTSRQLINEIDYQPHSYNATVDLNNPTRVFNRFTEFAVDYSKPLGQSWVITNFWGFNLPNYFYGFEDGPWTVVTLSNGRTYGTAYDGGSGSTRQIVELTATGLRETGNKGLYLYTKIEKDGSLLGASQSGSTVTFQRRPLTGFNAAGDPQWGSPVSLATAPVSSSFMGSDPYSWRHPQLSSNLVVSYDSERSRTGFHLGAVKQGTSQWLWKAMPTAGGLDGYGTFDSWCEYGGNHLMTSSRNIFAGFHGEFYQDLGQANQFFHYYDNGLFVGQFGNPRVNGVSINAPGSAGNSFAPTLVEANGSVYIYHNEEWGLGSHRWKPTGLEGIRELSATVLQGQAPAGTTNTNTAVVLPTVTVTATYAMASESATNGIFTVARTGATTSALTVNYTLSGTATHGFDYQALTGTVTIPAGASSATVTIVPIDDSIVESPETVVLSLSASANYTLGAATTGTVTINDNDVVAQPSNIPDLVVTAVSITPAVPTPGTPIRFNATIKNQGGVATPAGAIVGIGFYVDGVNQAWWFTSTGSLAPGASWNITSNDGPSAGQWTSTAGTHTLIAYVDDAGRISEANDANNTMTVNFAVGTSPNIPKVTIRPAAGGKMGLSWTATSGGVYQVSCKTNLSDTAWTALSGELTATGTSMSYTDAPPAWPAMRLYSVKQVR